MPDITLSVSPAVATRIQDALAEHAGGIAPPQTYKEFLITATKKMVRRAEAQAAKRSVPSDVDVS